MGAALELLLLGAAPPEEDASRIHPDCELAGGSQPSPLSKPQAANCSKALAKLEIPELRSRIHGLECRLQNRFAR